MTWDAAKGAPRRPRFNDLDIFRPLDSPYRAARAARVSAYGAAMLALANLLSGLLAYTSHRNVTSWLAQGWLEVALACTAVGLIAGLLCLVIMRRQPAWASMVLLAWSAIEALPWLTFHLYGHIAMRGLAAFALVSAIVGLRGALALRRFANGAHPPT